MADFVDPPASPEVPPKDVIPGLKPWHHGAPSTSPFERLHEYVVMATLGLYSQLVMHVLNTTAITNGEQLGELIDRPRPGGRGLVTVCNHVTRVDDPGVVAAVTPTAALLQPDKMRWTLCAANRCFKTRWLASFFRGGKVLPIERGGGLYQPAMDNLVAKLSAGQWIHTFPTGRREAEGEYVDTPICNL